MTKRAPAKKAAAKLPARKARDITVICQKIADGMSLTAIALDEGVSVGSLSEWLEATPERSARAREARALSARTWDDKAATVIEEAGDPFELAKAKELAHHYRWRASKIAPREYGDKVAVGGDPDAPPVTVAAVDLSHATPEQLRAIAAIKLPDGTR